MPCLMESEGAACVEPSIETALDGSYPIARPLFMYTAGQPEGAVEQYLNWIQSQEGQCILVELGYAPTNAVTCS
jgi:phosphate transport system substrate-binding protein